MTELQEERLHIALKTAHFEKSIEFYTALFEVGPVKLKDGYAKFEVKSPSLNFTLNRSARQGANPTGSGAKGSPVNHFGIQVSGSATVFQQNKRLQALGLTTELEEDIYCCYSAQDKVWVHDPDGNAWEIFAVLGESEERDASHTCCAN